MKKITNKFFNQFGYEIKKCSKQKKDNKNEKLVSLKYHGNNPKGNILFSYIIDPFLVSDESAISNSHTHHWESFAIARTFLEFGFNVDVVDYRRDTPVPIREYHVFMGVRTNFDRITKQLNTSCLKIVHLDTAHWIKNNAANYQRALSFQKKHRVAVNRAKLVEQNWAIENADCATILGNEFTIETYRYAKKKIYRVPISTCSVYPFPEHKNFNLAKNHYLWFGSTDFVHKGLDLVLDAFSEMEDYHLHICGPIEQEKKFETVYSEVLYNTPNIHPIGWIDITSAEFIDLCRKCVGMIYPSCSEGGGGSVIQCMHAGLIPIVSFESSVDIGSFGVELLNCTVDGIKCAVKQVSGYSHERLLGMSHESWKFVRENHTRDAFKNSFRNILSQILSDFSARLP